MKLAKKTKVAAVVVALCAAPLAVALAQGARAAPTGKAMMKPKDLAALKAELVKQHGEASRARIERGIDQVAALWRKDDGSEADCKAFVRSSSSPTRKELDRTFARFQTQLRAARRAPAGDRARAASGPPIWTWGRC